MPDFDISALALPLFLPADRIERYGKAFGAGADAVILDLEDGVAPDRKDLARAALAGQRATIAAAPCPVVVRINASGSADQPADIAAIASLPLAAIMLPKAESAANVAAIAKASGRAVLALIESAKGVAAAREIASTGARLAFGSIDYAADIGCAQTRQALLMARSELVLASRLAGIAPPLDGVTTSTKDAALVRHDAAHAAEMGFAGKLLIHPAQLEPARDGFRPPADEVAWAVRVLEAGRGQGATTVSGDMVDAPVLLRAERILARHRTFGKHA